MLGRRAATAGRLARAASRPFERVAQTLRGDGIDDMRFNGEQKLFRRAIPHLGPHPIIFDVGANVGKWTLWASREAPHARIHAFEPDPRASEELETATRDMSQVRRHRLALGSAPGTATLYSAGDITSLSSLHRRELSAFGLTTAPTADVRVDTVDGFCSEHGIERIGFLKADVEGHEHDLISGAARLLGDAAIDVLQFEYGGTYLDAGRRLVDVIELFDPNRYVVVKLVAWGAVPVGPADLREERFLLSNYAAILRRIASTSR